MLDDNCVQETETILEVGDMKALLGVLNVCLFEAAAVLTVLAARLL
jgi:hypothetical protein